MIDHFISVIIPTYNRASFLKTTINSLLRQENYHSYEIIVVDDGSTDNTEEVVKGIKDHKIKYFKKQNGERAAARNFGANLAIADYINFFDSDDIAYSNHLEEANNTIHELRSPEVFHLDYDIKDPDGNLIRKSYNWPQTINDRLIDGNHLSCNGVFVRKDIFAKNTFNENRKLSASEDYELWLRLASRYPFFCSSSVTSTVINHDSRSVIKINPVNFLERMDLLQEELLKDVSFVQRYGKRASIFQSYLKVYTALHLAMAKQPKKECYTYLFEAVKLNPQVIFTYRFIAALKNIML